MNKKICIIYQTLQRSLGTSILILLCTQTVFAATINVTVKQKGSGQPVEGATVVIDTGSFYGETDKFGQIMFPNVSTANWLKVLAPGYETSTKSMSLNSQSMTIYLEPLAFDNEGLEVNAERIVEKTSKIMLSAPELLHSAGSGGDPLKAISALPGIIPAEEGSAEVYMRGSNGADNIAWINNAPVGYLYHFGGFQSTINPSLIADINVFLGGFPVEYGDALGGVVDARLRAPNNDRMHYKFDISTITSSFLIEGPVGEKDGDSFFVGGRRSYLDLILSPADASDTFADENDEDPDQVLLVPQFHDFQALYHHLIPGGHVDTYLFTASDKLAFELRDTAKSDPQLAGEISESISYLTVGSTWQQRWNKQWDSIATLAIANSKSSDRVGRDDQGKPFFANVEQNYLHLQPELRWRLRSDSQLSFGLSSGYAKIPIEAYFPRVPSEDDPDYDLTTQRKYRVNADLSAKELSPYIKYRYQWTDRLTTQLGLRHTNIKISGGFHAHRLSPRAAIEYQLSPDTLLTTSWGLYIQMPSGEQVIESYGNPALLMTEAEHRILGIEQQINSQYSVKAEIYHKPMQNLVIAIDENLPPGNYSNQGSGEAYGFDLFIKRKPGQGKIGWLSLSWAKSKRSNEHTGVTRDFSGDQPLTLTAVWGQPFSASWKRWDWSIKTQVHSGQPYTAVIGRHREIANDNTSRWIPEYGAHNAERLPTYYKVDLRIGREILYNRSKMKFYFDIQNVTFANNITEYDYGNEYEKIDNPTEVTGMSFFPFFGLDMEF